MLLFARKRNDRKPPAPGRRCVLGCLLNCSGLFTVLFWVIYRYGTRMHDSVGNEILLSPQDDMYDTVSRLCQVGNKYAFWYMRHKSWVQCASNVPGYRLLSQSGPDWKGNYWYNLKQANEASSTPEMHVMQVHLMTSPRVQARKDMRT